jgi:hypothetical protein
MKIFQLLQWKYAVRLEALGLKHSRGSVTAHVMKVLNCKRKEVPARIQEELDKLGAPEVPPPVDGDRARFKSGSF